MQKTAYSARHGFIDARNRQAGCLNNNMLNSEEFVFLL